MKLEHLGIAVKSLEASVPLFEKIFGVKAGEMEFVAEQKVNVRISTLSYSKQHHPNHP
jgi:methylmalonyl-CoA/ethylmalonyl-CoA epimerase